MKEGNTKKRKKQSWEWEEIRLPKRDPQDAGKGYPVASSIQLL